jgi:TfoX/Sxy family transcriptional regulator of competence genes
MPGLEKSPLELVARFEELVGLVPEATARPMFGYRSLVTGGNMFMSLFDDYLVLRLSEQDRANFLDEVGGKPFEPMPGRPMKHYVVVPGDVTNGPQVEKWVMRSYAFARQLPAKGPKRR